MADSQMSKASKKNAKRRAAKKSKEDGSMRTSESNSAEDEFTPQRLLPLLKDELEKAKQSQDHKLSSKLREQIWVLTDMIQGVKTDIPEEDLRPILENLPLYQSKEKPAKAPVVMTVVVSDDRRVRNLNKKLDQIATLKERQAKGEVLEENQLQKIKSEDTLKEELRELEELLQTAFRKS